MKKSSRTSKQVKINSFKQEKKTPRGFFARLGKFFAYLFGALMTVLLVCFVTGIIVGCVFAVYVKNNIDVTVDESLFVTGTGDKTTKLYYYEFTDRTNRIGTAIEMEDERIYGTENSLWASYDEIPTYLREAFISIEDKRFWKHSGVDWRRTGGAVLNFFLGFDDSSYGGSTITQQLIKNTTGNDEATIQRKVQEILCALNLEKTKSKYEIIEHYLNIVPLSQSCIGVKAAAKKYFGKELSDLTLAECASLAAITKYPTKYDPIQNPENNIKRRNDVLNEMYEQGKISKEEFDAALEEELVLANGRQEVSQSGESSSVKSWYIDTVVCDVRDDLMEKYNISSQVAYNLIYSGGLSIFTLMDPEVQTAMEEVFADENSFPANNGGIQAQCSMVVLDPYTGDLLGVIGARGKKQGNLVQNYATMTKRAPGSSLKPLSVYGPALEKGIITYGSVYDDTPLWFNDEGATPYPKNTPDVYKGLTTINSAVERSVNTVAMKVLQDLTIDVSYDYLKNKFGFDYLVDYGEDINGNGYTDKGLAALALGQLNFGVTVRDIAAAYTVFPSGGVYNECHSYLYVYDSEGNLLLSNDDAGSIVFSEDTAYITTKMLQNVVNKGTGTSVSLRKQVDVAGKTGTAGNDYDRWFVGFTPYYVGAVWYGYSYPKSLSNLAANPSNKVFDLVMTKLHEPIIEEAKESGDSLRTFDDNKPSSVVQVTYCKDSGKLMTEACKCDPRGNRSDTGYFSVNNMPTEYCTTHILVDYDKTTNAYAHEYSLPQNLYKTALIKVSTRSFPSQIYVEDAQYVYRELPEGVRPAGWWGVPFFENAIPSGTYVGISNIKGGRQYNSFSYENYDFSKFETTEPPSGSEDEEFPDE